MNGVLHRFIAWGDRVFGDGPWHRVPYQPIVYLLLWGAVLRIVFTDTYPPIRFEAVFTPWTSWVWAVTGLVCPPLALAAWCLIERARWPRAALMGLWVRFGADVGQLSALLLYHVATVLTATRNATESRIYSRYIVAATMVFVALLVVRDVWALVATERLASRLRQAHE